MKPIHFKSVLTSGLIAGLVISLSAITMVPVVGNEMDLVLAKLGLPPLTPLDMVCFCLISLVFGIVTMYLYAALKPRFHSTTKTAVVATLIVWIVAYLINNLSLIVYGFIPAKLAITGIIWGLFELLLGSWIGSKFYKELN